MVSTKLRIWFKNRVEKAHFRRSESRNLLTRMCAGDQTLRIRIRCQPVSPPTVRVRLGGAFGDDPESSRRSDKSAVSTSLTHFTCSCAESTRVTGHGAHRDKRNSRQTSPAMTFGSAVFTDSWVRSIDVVNFNKRDTGCITDAAHLGCVVSGFETY